MKNILSEFVSKTEKTMPELTEDDIVTISYIAAKVSVKLQKIEKTYRNPKNYAEKALKFLEHNKNLVATFIVFNLDNMDNNLLYKPSEIKNEISKYLHTEIPDETSEIAAALEDKPKASSIYVTSNDISKAFKALVSEIDLVKLDTKEEVKKIKGRQKIKFLGKPYFYKPPPTTESLKRIIANPEAVILVFKSLKKLGLLPHLKFILEASFYVVRDYVRKERTYKLTKMIVKQIKKDTVLDEPGWESYRNLLLSASEEQLKKVADKLAEYALNYPDLCRYILLMALWKS